MSTANQIPAKNASDAALKCLECGETFQISIGTMDSAVAEHQKTCKGSK